MKKQEGKGALIIAKAEYQCQESSTKFHPSWREEMHLGEKKKDDKKSVLALVEQGELYL